jgi:hypothetical protein
MEVGRQPVVLTIKRTILAYLGGVAAVPVLVVLVVPVPCKLFIAGTYLLVIPV